MYYTSVCQKKEIFHGRHLGCDNNSVVMWHKIHMATPSGKHVWNLLHVVSTSKYKHHWLIFYEVTAHASLVQAILQCLASSSWQQIGSRLSQFLWSDAIGTLGRLLPTLLSWLHFTLGSDLPQEAAGMLWFSFCIKMRILSGMGAMRNKQLKTCFLWHKMMIFVN